MKRVMLLIASAGLVAGSLGGLVACSTIDPMVGASEIAEDDAAALRKLDDDWSAASAKKDVKALGSFYAENAVVYPPGAPMVSGKAACTKVWGDMVTDPNFKLTWKPVHVGASGELGFTTGTYEGTFTGPDGKPLNDKGKYMCVWQKQPDGSWKALHDMWNSDSN